ncbi:MAG: carboxymuconolactone decarboxylase family protein [Phycisphaerae bacterium]|nr:carboxymuconolactone decarboxylase family protein [Phycisphaerae bacterium]MCZ2400010.1 carboxymuconolactone decarboxylase family protein [Phycisphaerae bacterium]NUQ49868.1 carboxymuconolactone decarboxylase family protein [Phycisphaerae bacterium]
MSSAREHYEHWPQAVAAMREAAPEVARAFGTMFQKLMGEGALSVREKELIALAIGLALRCEPCIYAHLEKAMAAGATRAQIMELAGVLVMMQGGPGYVYVPKLVEAVRHLEETRQPT